MPLDLSTINTPTNEEYMYMLRCMTAVDEY